MEESQLQEKQQRAEKTENSVEDRKGKPGPKKGYKQTQEHIGKRILNCDKHYNWKGNDAGKRAGHSRAYRTFKNIGPCVKCGNPKSERHHKDGNTLNNDPSNIKILCRRCHQFEDGRMQFISYRMRTGNMSITMDEFDDSGDKL